MLRAAAGLAALVVLAAACTTPGDHLAEGIRALGQERSEDAIASFEMVLVSGGATAEEVALAHNGLADAHFTLNNFMESVANYTLLLEAGPDRVIHNNRGLAYHHLGRYAEATMDFDRALALPMPMAPGNFIIYYNRAGSLDALDMLQAAKDDLDTAIELNENFPQAFQLRSLINADLGEEEASRADAERALELGFDESAPVRPGG